MRPARGAAQQALRLIVLLIHHRDTEGAEFHRVVIGVASGVDSRLSSPSMLARLIKPLCHL